MTSYIENDGLPIQAAEQFVVSTDHGVDWKSGKKGGRELRFRPL